MIDNVHSTMTSPQCRNCSSRPLREHSLITRLRLDMADPCTKSEVSSVSRCREITWGVHSKRGHVTLTMPLSGKIFHQQGGTCYGKSVYQI